MKRLEPNFAAIQRNILLYEKGFTNATLRTGGGAVPSRTYHVIDAFSNAGKPVMICLFEDNEGHDSFKAWMRIAASYGKNMTLNVNGTYVEMKDQKMAGFAIPIPQRRMVASLWLSNLFTLEQGAESFYMLLDTEEKDNPRQYPGVRKSLVSSPFMLGMMGQFLKGWDVRGNSVAGVVDIHIEDSWLPKIWDVGCKAGLVEIPNEGHTAILRLVRVSGDKQKWTEVILKGVKEKSFTF